MFQNILVGYDGSKGAKAALESAAVMAKVYEADVTVLWVCKPLSRFSDSLGELKGEKEAADEYYKDRCSEVFRMAKRHDIDVRCKMRRGNPVQTILGFADEGDYDLIIVGHSDHSKFVGRLFGDTAERIADHAHCNVLVVKKQKMEFQTVS